MALRVCIVQLRFFCFLLFFLLCLIMSIIVSAIWGVGSCDAQVLFCEIVCLGILQCSNLYSSTFAKISVSWDLCQNLLILLGHCFCFWVFLFLEIVWICWELYYLSLSVTSTFGLSKFLDLCKGTQYPHSECVSLERDSEYLTCDDHNNLGLISICGLLCLSFLIPAQKNIWVFADFLVGWRR